MQISCPHDGNSMVAAAPCVAKERPEQRQWGGSEGYRGDAVAAGGPAAAAYNTGWVRRRDSWRRDVVGHDDEEEGSVKELTSGAWIISSVWCLCAWMNNAGCGRTVSRRWRIGGGSWEHMPGLTAFPGALHRRVDQTVP
jgi:hypothetical protein